MPPLKIIESQNHNQKTFNQNEYYQTIAIAMALTIIIIFINNQLNQSITITNFRKLYYFIKRKQTISFKQNQYQTIAITHSYY